MASKVSLPDIFPLTLFSYFLSCRLSLSAFLFFHVCWWKSQFLQLISQLSLVIDSGLFGLISPKSDTRAETFSRLSSHPGFEVITDRLLIVAQCSQHSFGGASDQHQHGSGLRHVNRDKELLLNLQVCVLYRESALEGICVILLW